MGGKTTGSGLGGRVLRHNARVGGESPRPVDIKCKDFVTTEKDNIAPILMWLAGYYSDEDAPPIVDFDKMKKDGEALGGYCGKHPDDSLITASEEVTGK